MSFIDKLQKVKDEAYDHLNRTLEIGQETMLLHDGYEDDEGIVDEFYELPSVHYPLKYGYGHGRIVAVTKNDEDDFTFTVVDIEEDENRLIESGNMDWSAVIETAEYFIPVIGSFDKNGDVI
jgi:hypothetical protein